MPRIDATQILTLLSGGDLASGEMATLLGVTRQGVHHHLTRLRDEGLVQQVGQGRGARWKLVVDRTFTWDLPPDDLGEDGMWRHVREDAGSALAMTSPATMSCLTYGVTEMLNNAIDHSRGSAVQVTLTCRDDITVSIADDGVGAFRHVREHFGLPHDHDAVAHIAKGRQTTAPTHHSGQGIFFTSKVVDHFQLEANGLIWKVDNLRDDHALAPSIRRRGTRVVLRTAADGDRRTKDVFDRFSEPDELRFDRSTVRVSLSDRGDEFMSRSEAKRIGTGLEGYDFVTLDFQGVEEVGQGFVDELFRVWARQHPDTTLQVVNASPEVAFMLERG